MSYVGNKPAQTTIPADDSVTTAMLKDDAVTADKVANAINTSIAANTSKVTNATHTGDVTGATALTIATDAVDIAMLSATGTADATTFLRGDNAWAAAGGDNTPAFFAYLGSNQTITSDTGVTVACDEELYDSDSAYNNSTYIFTCPVGGAGKYLWYAGAWIAGSGASKLNIGSATLAYTPSGGSTIGKVYTSHDYQDNPINATSIPVTAVMSLAEGDTVHFTAYAYTSDAGDSHLNGDQGSNRFYTWFGCHKLIGV